MLAVLQKNAAQISREPKSHDSEPASGVRSTAVVSLKFQRNMGKGPGSQFDPLVHNSFLFCWLWP